MGDGSRIEWTDATWNPVRGCSKISPGCLGIERQCRRQGVPFFFKQWGGVRKHATGRTLNGRTYDDFPSRRAERLPGADHDERGRQP